jgi:acetoacetyl-CoA synthetase
MMAIPTGDVAESAATRQRNPIFLPNPDTIARSQVTAFMRYCEAATSRNFADYSSFESFSVEDFRVFWRLFLRWSGLVCEGQLDPVCLGDSCESASFFPNLRLNYAEVLLADRSGDPALTVCRGAGNTERLTRGELRERVLHLAASLRRLGVRQDDRVVVVARNGSEAVIAALATAALGAAFSSCAPDMGAFAILTRFTPLEPVVLMGHLRPEPWDVGTPVADRLAEVTAGLPTLRAIVALDDEPAPKGLRKPLYRFADLIAEAEAEDELELRRFPFNQPLFIMFSSGTTGQPKCIVHGAGGTLIEHVKEHRLHCDLKQGDKLFFQTSCAWMMWQWQLSALASGAELVLYNGLIEGPETLWQLVAAERVTMFGTSPAYLQFCEEAGFAPGHTFDLAALRAILSTGSILYERQYDWVRDCVSDLPLQSISGGTDIIGCFVLGNPNLPVYRGEVQCRSLGLDVRALPPAGEPTALIGELICTNPFPSRPLGFYGDDAHRQSHEAYFSQNRDVWTHGDLIEFTPQGGARLHGRSDGVLNIRGIRVGPAEIYRILQDIPEVVEAMAVEQQAEEELGGSRMVLLVVLRKGIVLDDRLAARIRSELARRGSNALQPARIAQVDELPVTHSGKRSEAAARDAVNGRRISNLDALRNPECLQAIARHPIICASATAGVISETVNGNVSITAASSHSVDRLKSRDQLERELVRIYERVLRQSPIGRCDNFFELGGHSLMVLSLFEEVRALMHRNLPLTALFRAPTIESLAALILEAGAEWEALPDHATSENGRGQLFAKERGRFWGWTATLHGAARGALGFRTATARASMVDATALDATVRSKPRQVSPARKNAPAGLRLGTPVKRAWQLIYRLYGIRNNIVAGPGLRLGIGTVIDAPRRMEIGRDVFIGKFCTIECDGKIGDFVIIANNAGLIGRFDHDHQCVGKPMRFAPCIWDPDYDKGLELIVEDDVWIGYGAIVLSGVTIGRGAIIAAGSVVSANVAPYSIVAGYPARKVGQRFTEAQIAAHEMAVYGTIRTVRAARKLPKARVTEPQMSLQHQLLSGAQCRSQDLANYSADIGSPASRRRRCLVIR